MDCVVCGVELTGRQRKYCSEPCTKKGYRTRASWKEWESQYQRDYKTRPDMRKHLLNYGNEQHLMNYSLALSIVADGLPECVLRDDSCSSHLEIDHIKGDGAKERSEKAHNTFYRAIVAGRRKTDDLRILCHSHNLRERL